MSSCVSRRAEKAVYGRAGVRGYPYETTDGRGTTAVPARDGFTLIIFYKSSGKMTVGLSITRCDAMSSSDTLNTLIRMRPRQSRDERESAEHEAYAAGEGHQFSPSSSR